MSEPATVHASAVLVGETGILIRGAAGSGKSSLVLELLDGVPAAHLVADDRVVLVAVNERLLASPPPALTGLIEVRGQGIVQRPYVSPVIVRLLVDLLPPEKCPRLPEESDWSARIEGIALRRLFLPIGAFDRALRIGAALRQSGPNPKGSLRNPE